MKFITTYLIINLIFIPLSFMLNLIIEVYKNKTIKNMEIKLAFKTGLKNIFKIYKKFIIVIQPLHLTATILYLLFY